MEKADTVYLALVPLAAPETSVITRVADIIGRDPPGTRLSLAGKVPKVVSNYDSKQVAESVAQRLTELGLRPILCTDSELRRSSEGFLVHTVEFGQDYVLFYDQGGQRREMKSADAFLIIKGGRESYTTREKTETSVKFSPGKAILTSGLSVMSTKKKQVKEQFSATEYFARLYTPESSQPCVKILHDQLDYSFLKGEMASASLVNFNILVTRLQQAFPGAIFDDNLMRASIKQAYTPTAIDDTEVNCKLLYLQYLLK